MSEFCLSEKIRTGGLLYTIKVDDVKEFIKLLLNDCCAVDCIRIKERAGEGLV